MGIASYSSVGDCWREMLFFAAATHTSSEEETLCGDEPPMVRRRSYFSLSVVGHTVFAVCGQEDREVYHDTVESYTEEAGWRMEEEMRMDTGRWLHCSIVIDTSLVVIGGNNGS